MSERSGELSELLQRWSGGDARAQEEVFRLCYGELRHIARAAWSRERAQFSLRPTEIVNEAFLRLQGAARIQWNDSRHFFAVFSRAMRRAIIDHCRSANALKRPHAQHALSVDDLPIGEKVDADNILGVSLALEAFEKIDPFRAEVVAMHFYVGLNYREIGGLVGKSEDAIKKDWKVARLWLTRRLRSQEDTA